LFKKRKDKRKKFKTKNFVLLDSHFFLKRFSCHIKIKWQSLLTKKANFENFLPIKKQNFVFLVWTKIVIVNILVKMNYF